MVLKKRMNGINVGLSQCVYAVPGGVGSTVPVEGGFSVPPLYVLIVVVINIQVADCTVDFSYVYMLLCYIVLNIMYTISRALVADERQAILYY